MSNLLKWSFVNFQESEARLINSNEVIAKRLGSRITGDHPVTSDDAVLRDGFQAAEFEEEDEAAQNALLGEGSGNIYRESAAYEGPTSEELLEKAKAEIEEMKAEAEREAEFFKTQAAEEGRQAGYNEGFAKGQEDALLEVEKAEQKVAEALRETEAVREGLLREYEEKLQELERVVVEELTDIYDHVFDAGLKERREILFHLLDTTLHQIDSGREFIVRISQADYEYISARKEDFLASLPGVRMDLVADVMLRQGDGMIETGGGLFDCSIDVELRELRERILMLAYRRESKTL